MPATSSASPTNQKSAPLKPPGDECRHGSIAEGFGEFSHRVTSFEELTEIIRRQADLLAILSHELRSPLAAIKHCLDALRLKADDRVAQNEMQAIMERQLRQMTLLVSSLFDASIGTRGELQLQRQRIDLCAVLGNAIETLEAGFKQKHHHPVVTWPKSALWVSGDASRLEQVFVNLLDNASKYTSNGGKIMLSVQASDGYAVVRIRDSGVGIAGDMLPRIFDLFVRSDAGAVGSRAGLGIGLALVRSIVDQHGGNVSASSAGTGLGSEFIVRLPLNG